MTTINLITEINAPIEIVFDAARDIDVHMLSTGKTREKAIAGRTSGLCEQGDTVTWEATHFGVRQQLSSEITKLEKPYFFQDCMIKGAFKSICHDHYFEVKGDKTVMKDVFRYEVPYGLAGRLFNALVLKKYLHRFIEERNRVIKEVAEKRIKN